MNLTDYGVGVGNPADIVVLDAATPEQAVAEICHPLAVFKRGKRTVNSDAGRTAQAGMDLRCVSPVIEPSFCHGRACPGHRVAIACRD